MAIVDALLPEFDHEMAVTRKVLERVDDAQFGWKPHEKSMSLGRLATHVAEIPQWGHTILNEPEFNMVDGEYKPTVTATTAEVLDLFDRQVQTIRAHPRGQDRRRADEHLDVQAERPGTVRHAARGGVAVVGHEPPHPPSRAAERLPAPDRLEGARHLRAQRRRELALMAAREDAARPWPRTAWGLAALVFVVARHAQQRGLPLRRRRPGLLPPGHPAPPRARVVPARSDPHRRSGSAQRLPAGGRGADSARAISSRPPCSSGSTSLALLLLAWAARAFAERLGLSPWAQLAVLAALTLKHRVGMTGVNTLEGYGHPRMLAFAIGLAAVVSVLRARPARRHWRSSAAAFVVHPTTALWFGVWVGVALVAADDAAAAVAARRRRRWRRSSPSGPSAGARSAPRWSAWTTPGSGVLAGKDYLFATAWPADMWALAAAVCRGPGRRRSRVRRRLGVAHPREGAMRPGPRRARRRSSLVTLPFVAARVALAVQFQVSRVFWMLDFTAHASTPCGRWPTRGRRRCAAPAGRRAGRPPWRASSSVAGGRPRRVGDVGRASRAPSRAGRPAAGRLAGRDGLAAAPAGWHARAGGPVARVALRAPACGWRPGATCISRK